MSQASFDGLHIAVAVVAVDAAVAVAAVDAAVAAVAVVAVVVVVARFYSEKAVSIISFFLQTNKCG